MDATAGAEILINVVSLDEADTSGGSGPASAAQNHGVGAGGKDFIQGRLAGVARSESIVNDRLHVGIIHPVVVGIEQVPVTVVDFDHRIGQHAGNALADQRRAETAHDELGKPATTSADDKAADHDIVAGTDRTAST